jgi:hypothetical protein
LTHFLKFLQTSSMTRAVSATEANARRDWFNLACDLIGGQRAMARALDVGERSVRSWCAGDRGINERIIQEARKALRRHADACRETSDLSPP